MIGTLVGLVTKPLEAMVAVTRQLDQALATGAIENARAEVKHAEHTQEMRRALQVDPDLPRSA